MNNKFEDDIPPHLRDSICAAWKIGGMHNFAHIDAVLQWAFRARDYRLAMTMDFLHDVYCRIVDKQEREAA